MFIYITYKDIPELSTIQPRSSDNITDPGLEKSLLVNPLCPVRIMLEYIREKCRLGLFTTFDLCDESGCLMGLFNMPTYTYATDKFEHKKTYYIIVLKQESDKSMTVLPQLNHENKLYEELKDKVKKFMLTGEISILNAPSTGKGASKANPATPIKTALKKK